MALPQVVDARDNPFLWTATVNVKQSHGRKWWFCSNV